MDDDHLNSASSDDHRATDEMWDRHWCEHHLRRAFETLRKTHQPRSIEVFDGLLAGGTTAEVAEQFEMSVEAVKKIRQRIRAELREIVADQIAEEERHEG